MQPDTERTQMKELLRLHDPVRLSWIEATLAAEGIEAIILDAHTSSFFGDVYVVPRRVMVEDKDYARARRILDDAGEDR